MNIVSRKQWGAARRTGSAVAVTWPRGVDLWVHHTAGPSTQTPRQIQDFHMNGRGWSDVGYSYLIDAAGTVYEGRGREVQGAHSPGVNHEPSVALIGDYSKVPPSDAQHRAVYALREHLNAGKLRGHRENTQTSCPGDAAFRKIVQGPPPTPPKLTLRQRLVNGFRAAGFGGKSAQQAADRYLKESK